MEHSKKIALVAHDLRKEDLLEWVKYNTEILARHQLYATGATGKLIAENRDLKIHCFKSGPLGGDQQLGAMIANLELDILIFFWDPVTAQLHDMDINALLRMAVLYNVVMACNRATADFIISSALFGNKYKPILKNFEAMTS